jgi:GntR family transcriptional regulator
MSPSADEPRTLPRYIQVETALRTLLETGGYRPGDKLPPEPALAQQMAVSRATLREALRSFEQQGIISRRQGVGTFVNRRPLYIESGLETLESIEMLLQSRHLTPTIKSRQAGTERALPKAAGRLALKEGTPLTVVSSTYAVDDKRVAYLLEVTPAALVSVAIINERSSSLLGYMIEEKSLFDVAYAVAHIAPVHGSEEIRTALAIHDETLLFFIDQTVYTSGNVPCYYSRNYYLPTVFDFHLIRKVREM